MHVISVVVCKVELMQTEAVTQTGAYRSHEGADLSFVRRHTAEVCKSESCSWRAAGGTLIFCDSCGDVWCSSVRQGCHISRTHRLYLVLSLYSGRDHPNAPSKHLPIEQDLFFELSNNYWSQIFQKLSEMTRWMYIYESTEHTVATTANLLSMPFYYF